MAKTQQSEDRNASGLTWSDGRSVVFPLQNTGIHCSCRFRIGAPQNVPISCSSFEEASTICNVADAGRRPGRGMANIYCTSTYLQNMGLCVLCVQLSLASTWFRYRPVHFDVETGWGSRVAHRLRLPRPCNEICSTQPSHTHWGPTCKSMFDTITTQATHNQ